MWRSIRFTSSPSASGLAALALCAALAAGAAGAQDRGHAGHGSHPPPSSSYSRAVRSYAPPPVTLRDRTGAEVSLAGLLGHPGPLLLQFIFTTCPAVCPVLSGTFAAARERLGPEVERVRMVSISIDPEHDTPARLREYAERYGAGPRWRFLTGGRDEIVAVQKAFDAFPGNKMRHPPLTFLRPSPGAPWVRLDGFLSAAELAAEVRRLEEP